MQEVRDLRARSDDAVHRFARETQMLQQTRAAVVTGWRAIAQQLDEDGAHELAESVTRFVAQMLPAVPDHAQLAGQFRAWSRSQRVGDMERTR